MIRESEKTEDSDDFKDSILEADSVWDGYKDDDIEPEATPETELEDDCSTGSG